MPRRIRRDLNPVSPRSSRFDPAAFAFREVGDGELLSIELTHHDVVFRCDVRLGTVDVAFFRLLNAALGHAGSETRIVLVEIGRNADHFVVLDPDEREKLAERVSLRDVSPARFRETAPGVFEDLPWSSLLEIDSLLLQMANALGSSLDECRRALAAWTRGVENGLSERGVAAAPPLGTFVRDRVQRAEHSSDRLTLEPTGTREEAPIAPGGVADFFARVVAQPEFDGVRIPDLGVFYRWIHRTTGERRLRFRPDPLLTKRMSARR